MKDLVSNTMRRAWRSLPLRGRRRLFEAAARLAPAIDATPRDIVLDRNVPKIVVGFLTSPSGLGQSARLAARALQSSGHEVCGIDLGSYFYEQKGVVDFKLPAGHRMSGPAHVIAVINAPYVSYAFALLGRSFLKQKYVTGCWAWELSRVPPSWRNGLRMVHEVATPSSFVAHAINSLAPVQQVYVAPHPVALDCLPPSFHLDGSRRPDQPFTVLCTLSVGSGFARKNPLASIQAFKMAFGRRPDCRLRLLVTNAEHHAPAKAAIENAVDDAPNVELRWTASDRDDWQRWCGTPDVYISLHRSEGFGLSLAEAMCSGYPVVATGWSGNMQFMTPQNSFPVDYRLVAVCDSQDKYPSDLGPWAEPDWEHAAGLLQQLEKEPEKAQSTALEAAHSMQIMLSPEHFTNALHLRGN